MPNSCPPAQLKGSIAHDWLRSDVTPEPSGLILLGTGVIGAAGMLRRRFLLLTLVRLCRRSFDVIPMSLREARTGEDPVLAFMVAHDVVTTLGIDAEVLGASGSEGEVDEGLLFQLVGFGRAGGGAGAGGRA